MMKLKVYIIYAIIIVLCIVAFTGLLSGNSKNNKVANSYLEKNSKIRELREADAEPTVGIGLGKDYGDVVAAAINNTGGFEGIVKEGDFVLIKPNICTLAEPGSPVITDYRAVQQVVDIVMEYSPSKIIVAEGSIAGNAFDSINLKVNKYGSLKNVGLININDIEKEECIKLKPKNSATGKHIYIPQIYLDADVVINIAKLKTHHQAVVSLSLKNAFGIPSRKVYGTGPFKGKLHDILGMNEAIVDINLIRLADFYMIEGIVGGEGYGPLDNTPVESNIVFAGRDPVALDTVAATFMGFEVEQVPHLKLAAEKSLGILDLNRIKIVGADLNSIKIDFKSEFKK